jgi:hypothetical protein
MPRRCLSRDEIAEAQLVFGSGLDYTRAYVVEEAAWPDWIDALGARLQKRMRHKDEHNAITLGNTSYFPVRLTTGPESVSGGHLRDMSWLIHELTHQWQYQRLGWRYLARALRVQLQEGRRAYDYRGEHPTVEEALQAALTAGRRLANFNLEQQGDLARDYYVRLKQRKEFSAWEPFITEFR